MLISKFRIKSEIFTIELYDICDIIYVTLFVLYFFNRKTQI